MTGTLTIVGLGGSLAAVSRSRAALEVALAGAASAGAETTLLDLRELDLPMYDPDAGDEPTGAAARLVESCYAADGMLWSSPLYQGTISGAFKNALDWLHALGRRDPPFLHDKVIGLISAAGGTHGLQAVNTMEFSVRALRAWAVPYVVPVAPAARDLRRDGPDPGRGGRAAARDARERGRPRRRGLRGRPRAPPPDGVRGRSAASSRPREHPALPRRGSRGDPRDRQRGRRGLPRRDPGRSLARAVHGARPSWTARSPPASRSGATRRTARWSA